MTHLFQACTAGYSTLRPRGRGTLTWAAFALLLGAPAVAQEAGDTLRASRIPPGTAPPVVDGVLGDPVWSDAAAARGFRQREPSEGEPASDDTEIRILFDEDHLYVGILARDAEPDRIVSRILQRDRVLDARGFGGFSAAGDDVVALLLDTFNDQRNAVVLATNPNGAQFDALVSGDGDEVNVDWRGVWEVGSARVPEGWSTEFAIPWRSLRFDADAVQVWGLNVTRFVQRTQEETMWRSWEREGGGFERVSRAGTLVGMADLPRASLNLEAKPYLLAGRTWERAEAGELEGDGNIDWGLDLKSEVLPGLVLDLTYNTDFAQVEVDDQQVNLTRFSLFFPERRDFFLENAGIFEFGQRGFFEPPPYLMFFSRRIGIGDDGEVPILGGGRLTGRAGAQSIGLLTIATDQVPGRDREIFNVARIKRDVGESAYVGFMATDRRGVGDANTVFGGDFSTYLHPSLQASGFASRSTTEGIGGEGWAYQGSLNWSGDLYGGFLQLLNIDPGVVASSGFVTRTDIRRTQGSLRRTWRSPAPALRRIEIRGSGDYQSTVGGRFQDWSAGPRLSLTFESGDDLSLGGEWGESRVDEDFDVADRVPVPAGRYRTDEISFRGSTADSRPWTVSTRAGWSSFYGGDLWEMGADLTITPSPAFSFEAGVSRNDVDLPNGSFVADIYSFRATWAASTRLVTNARIQYNRLTGEVFTNVRLNFIHTPGSDLFLVFTEERGVDDDLWAVADRGLVAKVTYLFRF
ncbi:MAG TPA: DUF5916 domain-containing protein [Longimicrobiales bacterium]|nr:DUF5916 domain-containing protein [Longimicrobiales bacterium]